MLNRTLLKEFGDRIRDLRKSQNSSQEILSFKTGFHRTYVGMIERGERNISLTNMAVFAKVFELTVSELLDFSSTSPHHSFNNYEVKTEK